MRRPAGQLLSDYTNGRSTHCRTDQLKGGGVPTGIRTRVSALKGPRPRPLDDGDTRRTAFNDSRSQPRSGYTLAVFTDPVALSLAAAFLVVAVLYASVGHAGASGYLAAMSLLSVATPVMRPTALVLNLLVASIATVRFRQAGCLSWSLLWPFALGSIPFAFIGGAVTLPGQWYRVVVGIVLLLSAVRLWIDFRL